MMNEYLSVLPIGLSIPPIIDNWISPFYKFHWTPIVVQYQEGQRALEQLIGMHSLGFGLFKPDGALTPVFKFAATTGVNSGGIPITSLSAEFETTYASPY